MKMKWFLWIVWTLVALVLGVAGGMMLRNIQDIAERVQAIEERLTEPLEVHVRYPSE